MPWGTQRDRGRAQATARVSAGQTAARSRTRGRWYSERPRELRGRAARYVNVGQSRSRTYAADDHHAALADERAPSVDSPPRIRIRCSLDVGVNSGAPLEVSRN